MRVRAIIARPWVWLTAGLISFYAVYLVADWHWLGRFGETPSLVILFIAAPGAAALLSSKIDRSDSD
jgi:hypothetical protein